MKHHLFVWLSRIFLLAALVLPGLALPQFAQAAGPILSITSNVTDVSVTVHAAGLPSGQTFTARMGPIGSKGVNGTAVGDSTASADGQFDATYTIPDALHGQANIAIRIDGSGGFFAYNWFTNKTNGSAPPAVTAAPGATSTLSPTPAPGATPAPLPAGSISGMSIQVSGVVQNDHITVNAYGFPASTDFSVRIGPYYTFWRNGQVMKTINSGKGGNFQFDVDLPESVKGVELVTIRLDGTNANGHQASYNAFTNVNGGSSGVISPTSTPGSSSGSPTSTPVATAVPSNASLPINQSGCQVTNITPTQSIPTHYDYDAVWTVKNTGTVNWDNHAVDYVYNSGEKMQKYTAAYDLPKLVKPGDSVDLSADLVAPGDRGTYTTTWVLRGDRGVICTLPLTVVVK
jgi:hypothetical protein